MIDVNAFLKRCDICPRECCVDRTKGKNGFCRAGDKIEVYSAYVHYGEEPPISGTKGSGTIFFNHCNMRCVYCQNYRFSQVEDGKAFELEELADLMISLQHKGAHNINLVTPTHYAVQIANAVISARKSGLALPIVYNSSGYEKLQTLKLLEDIIDVYLVDMRYGDNRAAAEYSSCHDYVEVNMAAVREMQRQAGNLKLSHQGLAERGVIIRHLILPSNTSGTESVFKFISDHLGNDTYISLMSQYYPAHNAYDYINIARKISQEEYNKALSLLRKYSLKNGWVQDYIESSVDSNFAGTNIEPDIRL